MPELLVPSTLPDCATIAAKPIADANAARAELDRLAGDIGVLREKLALIRAEALACYRDIGERVELGQPFTQLVRTTNGTRLGLKGWAEELHLKRQSAYKYLHLKQNWNVLKDLKGDQETLDDALKVLAIADEKSPAAPKTVAIEPASCWPWHGNMGVKVPTPRNWKRS
jgi:hypothetical protein